MIRVKTVYFVGKKQLICQKLVDCHQRKKRKKFNCCQKCVSDDLLERSEESFPKFDEGSTDRHTN